VNEFDLLFHDTEAVTQGSRQNAYSTAVLIDQTGNTSSSRKKNLIPIAEYLPGYIDVGWIRSWLEQTFGNFISAQSPGEHAHLTLSNGVELTPLICYDALFYNAGLKQGAAPGRYRMIAVLSNDSWFGTTRATYQHSAFTVLRSIE